jgi:hypothetical protein
MITKVIFALNYENFRILGELLMQTVSLQFVSKTELWLGNESSILGNEFEEKLILLPYPYGFVTWESQPGREGQEKLIKHILLTKCVLSRYC